VFTQTDDGHLGRSTYLKIIDSGCLAAQEADRECHVKRFAKDINVITSFG